jgi:hypothetical protein
LCFRLHVGIITIWLWIVKSESRRLCRRRSSLRQWPAQDKPCPNVGKIGALISARSDSTQLINLTCDSPACHELSGDPERHGCGSLPCRMPLR